ncbi:MAG: hypothetical protein U5N86_03980 [Planctomycetota bacterium]|nr:hypothetical protein [Planctomycetota bacterium]
MTDKTTKPTYPRPAWLKWTVRAAVILVALVVVITLLLYGASWYTVREITSKPQNFELDGLTVTANITDASISPFTGMSAEMVLAEAVQIDVPGVVGSVEISGFRAEWSLLGILSSELKRVVVKPVSFEL